MESQKIIISPKTKVLQLIESYPHLEDVLIRYVPAFSKLKNPVVRKTVAKVATLQQAATIGGVKVEDLINVLRKEVGQDAVLIADEVGFNTVQPAWFDEAKIVSRFDVREMLNSGEHPVNQVISDLKKLNDGEIYQIIAPFIPAPLVEKAISLGYDHWIDNKGEELFTVAFIRRT